MICLLVEDNPDDALAFRRFFKEWRIVWAKDKEQALFSLDDFNYDIIVLDFMLGQDEDSSEVYKAIRASYKNSGTLIVFHTGEPELLRSRLNQTYRTKLVKKTSDCAEARKHIYGIFDEFKYKPSQDSV